MYALMKIEVGLLKFQNFRLAVSSAGKYIFNCATPSKQIPIRKHSHTHTLAYIQHIYTIPSVLTHIPKHGRRSVSAHCSNAKTSSYLQ